MVDVVISGLTAGVPADADLFEFETTGGASRKATRTQVNPTAPETKTAYESNADTNEFSDAEQTKLAGVATGATDDTTVDAHIADVTAAHAGTAISNTPAGNIAATTVQAAIDELDGEKTDDTTVDAHIADVTDAHDASAISNVAAGNIASTDVQAAINELDTEKSSVNRTINAQTGTAFTPALTDAGVVITMDNAAANVLTLPTNAAVAYPVGAQLDVSQLGAGVTTITGDTGVTVNGVSAGSGALSAQFGSITLLKLATNTWLLTGNHDAVA